MQLKRITSEFSPLFVSVLREIEKLQYENSKLKAKILHQHTGYYIPAWVFERWDKIIIKGDCIE